MKTGQVFLSHTSDMAVSPGGRSFVQAALDAVGRAGMAPVDMRYFAAREGMPAEYCRQRVRGCEIYVAVVGFRYGSRVPGEAVSYTELEFDEASKAGVPRLVFLLAEAASSPGRLADTDRGPVEGFRQRLRDAGLLLRGFTSADSLELEVFHALSDLTGQQIGGVAAATRTLPHDIASFTGREPELGQLQEAAARAVGSGGVVGIHAIGGMAGVGKTTFAVHAAHQLAGRFPDGQIFLPLHGHTTGQRPVEPADALASLLQISGVAAQQIPAGLEARTALWRDRVAGKQLLLILDDATGHEQVRPLLPGTAGSLVLVTSRRHLTALDDTAAISLDTLAPEEATALLIRLAARPGLSSQDAAVGEITALCGCLPLAVAMLARQLHHHPAWTAAGLAADLAAARDRLELMRTENLSVAAAFDLSYRDLAPDQQRLFSRLGLHPGTDIDAYAAAALDGTDLAAARRSLDALYDQYLLAEPARGRYRLHDLIRQHARLLAAADPPAERDAAVSRLLDYYLRTARTADRHLPRRAPAEMPAVIGTLPAGAPDLPTRAEAVSWMEAERLNLHAAVSYAATYGHPGHAVAIPVAMHSFLRTQGHWDQALALHNTALSAARHTSDHLAEAGILDRLGVVQTLTGDYPAATATLTQALERFGELGDRTGEAWALHGLGVVQTLTGDYPAATGSLTQALELFGELGDRLGEAEALQRLGVVQRLTGNYQTAAASQTRALQLYRGLGDQLGEVGVLNELGVVQHLTGNYPAAIASQVRALQLYLDLGNRLGQANALTDLGVVQTLTGDYPAATASQAQALQLYRDLGNRLGEASTLNSLGVVLTLTGNYPAAAASQARALGLCRGLGDRFGEAIVLADLGAVQRLTGDYPAATASLTQALKLHRDQGNRLGEASTLSNLAAVQTLTGDYPAAAGGLAQALTLYQDLSNRLGEAEVLNTLGESLLASASPAQAHARHEQALAIATDIASPLETARALEGIGRCQLQDGNQNDGAEVLHRALAIYQRIGSPNAQRVETTLRDQEL